MEEKKSCGLPEARSYARCSKYCALLEANRPGASRNTHTEKTKKNRLNIYIYKFIHMYVRVHIHETESARSRENLTSNPNRSDRISSFTRGFSENPTSRLRESCAPRHWEPQHLSPFPSRQRKLAIARTTSLLSFFFATLAQNRDFGPIFVRYPAIIRNKIEKSTLQRKERPKSKIPSNQIG